MNERMCPIMGTDAELVHGDWIKVSSNAGIKYFLSEEAYQEIKDQGGIEKITSLDQVKISTHILQQNIKNTEPNLTYNELEKISQNPKLNVSERFNLLLRTIKWNHPNIGENILWNVEQSYYVAIGSNEAKVLEQGMVGFFENHPMLLAFFEDAIQKGFISYGGKSLEGSIEVYLTLKGHQYIESLGHQLSDSDQIFVAMWFNETTKQLYEHAIKPAIEQAGYKVMRIDDKSHNEKICDEIIAEIRKSKALVADMTCGLAKPESWSKEDIVGAPRGGVFYEAGFAHGLGIPVIWTVNQEIADIENVSHFDVRQYNQIRWTEENLEGAKKEILNRIEATLGQGPHLEQK